jgi:hypothetical protein
MPHFVCVVASFRVSFRLARRGTTQSAHSSTLTLCTQLTLLTDKAISRVTLTLSTRAPPSFPNAGAEKKKHVLFLWLGHEKTCCDLWAVVTCPVVTTCQRCLYLSLFYVVSTCQLK